MLRVVSEVMLDSRIDSALETSVSESTARVESSIKLEVSPGCNLIAGSGMGT